MLKVPGTCNVFVILKEDMDGMKRSGFVFLFVIVALCVSIGAWYFNAKPYMINGIGNSEEAIDVLPNKKWVFAFSESLKESTVNSSTVFIQNRKGKNIDVHIELLDNRIITVHPPKDGYELKNGPYSIVVSKGVKAKNGQPIKEEMKVEFNIHETLQSVKNKKQLNSLFQNHLASMEKTVEKGLFSGFSMGRAGSDMSSEAMDDSDGEVATPQSSEFSETNVQVAGVDEGDIVKTDGTFIYQIMDNKLTIFKVNAPEKIEHTTEVRYNNFTPSQLYVDKEHVVVIGYEYGGASHYPTRGDVGIMPIMPMYSAAKAIVYDFSNKKELKEIQSTTIEGNLLSTRKVDDYVYLITNHYPNVWTLKEDIEVDLRPRISTSLNGEDKKEELEYVDYEKIYHIPGSTEPNFMNIVAINIKKQNEKVNTVTYVGSGNEIFMSRSTLYITVPTYPEFDGIGHWFDHTETEIYKFNVDKSNIEYKATGTVPGRLLNQFSMDEFEGHFRVATTTGNAWDETAPSGNHLFVMDQTLEVIGSVEDLARGERIYSVRFMGEKAYVVTFKEVDPLFVFDLSNPTDPKVLGELKIPGFSNYLHPYDENHLIGFGYNTTLEKGHDNRPFVVQDGVKLSLFDVSDPTDPKEKFTEIIGGRATYSQLNYDHKALLFHKEKDIFAFPIVIYEQGSKYDYRLDFQGAFVYGIDLEKGFTRHLEISHSKSERSYYESWEEDIHRVLYIGDHLYAVSPKNISAHKITW